MTIWWVAVPVMVAGVLWSPLRNRRSMGQGRLLWVAFDPASVAPLTFLSPAFMTESAGGYVFGRDSAEPAERVSPGLTLDWDGGRHGARGSPLAIAERGALVALVPRRVARAGHASVQVIRVARLLGDSVCVVSGSRVRFWAGLTAWRFIPLRARSPSQSVFLDGRRFCRVVHRILATFSLFVG